MYFADVCIFQFFFKTNPLEYLSISGVRWVSQEWGGFGGTVAPPKPGVGAEIGGKVEAPEEPRGVRESLEYNSTVSPKSLGPQDASLAVVIEFCDLRHTVVPCCTD